MAQLAAQPRSRPRDDAKNDVDALCSARAQFMSGLIGSCCEEQEAQEAAAQAQADEAQAAKLEVWKEREKQLLSELSYDDNGNST